MATQVLLTRHHDEAMEIACQRGLWMPLALPTEKLPTLFYLSAIRETDDRLHSLLEIRWFEPWCSPAATPLWLPVLGRLLPLPRPVPLGDRQRLQGWLPERRDQFQVLDLLPVLEAERLSDLVCGRPGRCRAGTRGRAPRRSARADRAPLPCGRDH
ncbi:hypothetical protein [Vulcanococcus sp.]|uniref:hypothetical protein n=1 Tax=Vulcanococcus sp. TaxID=2856995 RepID=UPI003C0E4502